MKRLVTLVAAAGLIVAGWGRPAGAVVAAGDKPALEFQATNGTPVSLAKLKGKIVVVDFWATWCGPCMAEAGHMVSLNEKYGPQGMQFVGISLDSDKQAMTAVAKEKGFTWPQYFDGKGWQNAFAKTWGVSGIPATFLIGPDGDVLWTGHPGNIDPELAKAFREHPPQLVDPKLLAAGKAAVEQAGAAMKRGDAKAAIGALARVPADAKADKEFAATLAGVQQEVASAGEQMLATVDPLIKAGNYAEAVAKLKDLSDGLANLPAGAKAKKQLGELSAKPEVKAALAKAERGRQGQAALDVAVKLQADKKDEQAYPRFKAVAKDFADTDAGGAAAVAAKEYEKDGAFVKRVTESAVAGKATSSLKLAQSYAGAGRTDLARKKYQDVVDQFPGTTYADQATKALAALPK